MAADGSIIIDTRIDTQGIRKGTSSLESDLRKFGSVAKKIGGIIATVFAVDKIVDFAKEAVELGSDLQEVQNVVDVTFETMNEDINDFAKHAAETAGLSETMAKRYAGTFGAMADAFGFAESEAYEMATALTQLSGDVASFYNITQDEAYTKLKSVFTGETESLKDLGVVMTQTALDAYAMANGFEKTTAQMTEQEKVALRYEFILKKLNKASGDFSRTSGSWANQTRLLSLQFDSLRASIGAGLISALTPVIGVINSILSGLQAVANAFRQLMAVLFGGSGGVSGQIDDVAEGYENASDGASGLADSTEKAGKAAKKYLSSFDEITKFSSRESGGSGGGGAGSFGDIENIEIGESESIEDNISPQIQAIADKITALLEPIKNIDFTPLKNSLDILSESFGNLGRVIGSGLEWAWFNILVPFSKWGIEKGLPALIDALSGALDYLGEILGAAGPIFAVVWNDFLQPLAEWTGEAVVTALDTVSEGFTNLSENIDHSSEATAERIVENFEDAARMTDAGFTTPTREEMLAAADLIGQAFSDAGDWISEKWGQVSSWLSENVAQPTADFFAWACEQISTSFENAKQSVEEAWNAVSTWFDTNVVQPIEDLFFDIEEAASSVWDSIVENTLGVWQEIENAVAKAIQKIQSWINGLTGKTVYANVKVNSSGGGGTNANESVSPYSLRSTMVEAEVPYLATGAVIPPNAPFLAMLGDQRHGTNIEAPLATIEEAVNRAMNRNSNLNNQQIVSLLHQILNAVLGIEIDGEILTRAVDGYKRKTAVVNGG